MIPRSINTICWADLQTLISESESENRTLDYKEEPPDSRDPKNKERTLQLISAFANTRGGDIIYGIRELKDSSGRNTGIPDPSASVGFTRTTADETVRQIDQMIRSGVVPRISGVEFQTIPQCDIPGAVGPVVIVRIHQSPIGPHMIRQDGEPGNPRFYSRGGANNNPMDVQEIRESFLASENRVERIRRFHSSRLESMRRGEVVDGIRTDPTIVIHSIPFGAFDRGYAVTPNELRSAGLQLRNYSGSWPGPFGFGADGRFILEGYLSYDFDPSARKVRSYLLLHRNGIAELAHTTMLTSRQQMFPRLDEFEGGVIVTVERFIRKQAELGVIGPYFVFVSLINVKGFKPFSDRAVDFERTDVGIDRTDILAPSIVIESAETDITKALKPAFDCICNAMGLAESPNYDEYGNRRS